VRCGRRNADVRDERHGDGGQLRHDPEKPVTRFYVPVLLRAPDRGRPLRRLRFEAENMQNPVISRTAIGLALWLSAGPVLAQDPTGGAAPAPTPPAAASSAAVAPTLKAHADPIYPADALRDRVAGTVGLEIVVDETGHVVDAKVVEPAGHGFDEAALDAVKTWTFEPARQNDAPVRATIQLTLPFEPPPLPAPAKVEPRALAVPVPALPPAEQKNTETTLVLGRKPISAASSSAVRDRDFALRPIGSVQDILRVTPGLVMVQHSGGGKANQYFLRGFDADHGTDIALSIDGIPINLVSHAHGQGFSDTNFIIPETVERVEISKGPYFANQGDFATAGAVNLVTRDGFEHSSLGFGTGSSPGHGSPS
jgi:TonB family protein